MAIFGWCVLALVFVDELLAMTAIGVWGWQASPRWLLVWLLPLLNALAQPPAIRALTEAPGAHEG